ncbi:MAG: DNA polymerase III subunit beta [Lachnospiraceae bacterium]|nr:DNA polymerase III subunit beta [Lachnospiraceae bacterium]MDE6627489.1 DNA polymerase III subunit beta [Lachnospiraceae bacterium]
MKISCSKTALMNGINIVSKAVSTKSTMSNLQCILIESSLSEIRLIANDIELGIETIIDGVITEAGRIALDAKLLSDIIRKLPDSEVMIETNANYQANIRCERSKFNIMGTSGEDFNYLPEVEKNKSISISQFTLKEVIRQTIFSISDQENTKIMTGELFEINGDTLRVVSLDGHRISIRKVQLKESYESMKAIVPGKTLNDISKILTGGVEDEIHIYLTDKHILFEFEQTKVVSRLLEGEFYRIDQMLSNDYETKLSVNKKEFLDCLDRASLFISESDKKPIILNIEEENIYLKIDSSLGSMNDEIEIKKEGKDLRIGFNPKFLMDALRAINDEVVDIYMINAKSPCFIKAVDESYIYLILPISIAA